MIISDEFKWKNGNRLMRHSKHNCWVYFKERDKQWKRIERVTVSRVRGDLWIHIIVIFDGIIK